MSEQKVTSTRPRYYFKNPPPPPEKKETREVYRIIKTQEEKIIKKQ